MDFGHLGDGFGVVGVCGVVVVFETCAAQIGYEGWEEVRSDVCCCLSRGLCYDMYACK